MSRRAFLGGLAMLATGSVIIGCSGDDKSKKKDDKASKPKSDTPK